MAISSCYPRAVDSEDGKLEMTLQEFKKWLKSFDADKDGRISTDELRDAVRSTGGWFSGRKAKNGMKSADKDGSGYIDQSEFQNLVDFAQKELGIRIVSW